MMSIANNNFLKEEQEFLADAEIDYVPLHDIVRIFSSSKLVPTEEDYLQALDLLSYLLTKYGSKLKYYMGPGVEIINKTAEELLDWLQEMWYAGKYKEIKYGIWFELE